MRIKSLAALGLGVALGIGVAPATATQLFIDHCAACHGEDARGIKDQGADLIASKLMKASSDSDIIDFLKTGRQPDAPDSTMKLLMPAFDYLTDDELAQIIAFTRRPK
jgi:mono/diheme cytochrome c family protein